MLTYGNSQTDLIIGPECYVTICNPSNKKSISVIAIVDSGAALTCIPKQTLERLGNIVRGEDVDMMDANGNSRKTKTYFIDIIIGNYPLPNSRILEIPPKRYALIGRDILNTYKVMLNARTSEWRLNCGGSCDHLLSRE